MNLRKISGLGQKRSDHHSFLGPTLLLTAMVTGVFLAAPNSARANSMQGIILVPLILSLLPMLTVLVAVLIKWPVLRFLLGRESEKLTPILVAVTIAEIVLYIFAWLIASSLSEGDLLTEVVSLLSPDLGKRYAAQGVTAHNAALIFLVMYLTMTTIQFILAILPNAYLLRDPASGLVGVFKSGRELLVSLVFALIAPLLAGFLFTGFSGIKQERAAYEYWQSRKQAVPSPQNSPTVVARSPAEVPVVPAPVPGSRVEPKQIERQITPENRYSELVEAAKVGDLAAVQRLISEIDINAVSVRSALLRAAGNGHLDVMKEILDKGASFSPDDQVTALLSATERGYSDVVQFVVAKGVDVNAKGKYEQTTALILASKKGRIEIVMFLLDKGADVNATDRNRETALRSAVAGSHTELIKILLKRGANPNVQSHFSTSLELAAMKGSTGIVKLLLDSGADANAKSLYGKAPLISAASEGYTDIVELLLDNGANTEMKSAGGDTPLILAASKRRADIVRLLLNKGADVNARSARGETALMRALADLEIVKLLLEKGADVNAKDKHGRTALSIAYSHSLSRTARLLKKYGARIM
ncbi:MAG: ankyrin repeat domain-containing protein [Desulfomonilaceae bacterium]